MKITKEADYYILNDYHELYDYESSAAVLECFLCNTSVLLFGCKWRVLDINNIDNEDMDERLKKFYKSAAPYIVQDEDYFERARIEKQFIDERTVLINNEWPFPWEAPNKEVKETIWFQPRDRNDIIESMKRIEFFSCIVLDKACDFDDHSYEIGHFEEIAGTALVIIDKKGDFADKIIPKLQKVISNLAIELE